MLNIGIQNLRSLKSVENAEIKPITVLVGKNSSGKSTFLRVFPLIKQTLETRTSEPILWYGSDVDFGDFKQSLYRKATSKEITLSFTFNVSKRDLTRFARILHWTSTDDCEVQVEIKVSFCQHFISKVHVEISDQTINIIYKSNNKLSEIEVNGTEFDASMYNCEKEYGALIPGIPYRYYAPDGVSSSFKEDMQDKLTQTLKRHCHKSTKIATLCNALDTLYIGNKATILSLLKKNSIFPHSLIDYINDWTIENDEFLDVNNKIICYNVPEIIELCNSFLTSTFISVKYITPLRANVDRYYRKQGLYVEEIDPNGQNIPMFLANLSNEDRSDFESWSNEYFGINFMISSSEGHTSLDIKDNETGETFNLADTGFGYSQILPILIQLWLKKDRSRGHYFRVPFMGGHYNHIITIEQPELHLHPALQAKLIDVMAKTVKMANEKQSQLSIIMETHSETIVNRLGYLITKKMLNSDDVNVLFFNKNSALETNVESKKFTENGMIKDWPIGFFSPERINNAN